MMDASEHGPQPQAAPAALAGSSSSFIPGARYPIRYADIVDPAGPCEYQERRFRRHSFYEAGPCWVIQVPGRVILDTQFGSLLRSSEGEWRIVPDAFYTPFRPGDGNYLSDVSPALDRALSRGRVQDLTLGEGSAPCHQFPILGRWSRVYFHLLSESLGQIAALRAAFPATPLRAVAPGNRSAVQEIAIRELAANGIACVTATTRFVWVDNAVFYTGFFRHASINPVFSAAIRSIKTRLAAAIEPAAGRLVYVSRLGANARPLLNEAELAECASHLGYEVVDPGRLAFDDQVRLFSSTRAIVGPHGAGLTNAAFAPPGSFLIELRPLNRPGQSPMLNESYRRVAAAQGLNYDFAMFKNPPDSSSWSIDIKRTAEILKKTASLALRG